MAGAKLFAGEREVGRITSATASGRSGTVALGYVHRDFVAPETELTVATASGAVPVRLRPTPFTNLKAPQ